MCGIAGFAGWQLGAEAAGRTVRAMCDAIVHRGPDDSGYFLAPEVALTGERGSSAVAPVISMQLLPPGYDAQTGIFHV